MDTCTHTPHTRTHTHAHTCTQTKYSNPHVHVPRVNYTVLYAGFEKSTNHYKIECNTRLEFNSSVHNLFYTYDIIHDEICDFQFGRGRQEGVNLFKVELVPVNSTNPLVAIDFDNSEATVFIDDSMEEECSELLDVRLYLHNFELSNQIAKR